MANRPAPALVLRDGDRDELVRLTRSTAVRAGLAGRARIVLAAAEGQANERIAEQVGQWQYDHLYNNFGAAIVPHADATVQRSAQRYVDWVSGANDHLT